ncbi:MAG: ATP-dependent helicase [Deltaproteobacteria bacterium]|nr:ATP-dependent helicase [Deltaproteobacteria bacterium]
MSRYLLKSTRAPRRSTLDLERDLNTTQRDAVAWAGGPLLIIAGAGSGKTRTLTYRAAHLIERGVDPQRILLCTFTNRAAREMVERLEGLTGIDLHRMWAGTFHHVANKALRRHAQLLDIDEGYSILDQEDARELMASCLAEEGAELKRRRYPQARVLLHITSLGINRRASLTETLVQAAPRFLGLEEAIGRIIERYAARKHQLGLVDYDDLLLHFRALLRDHPAAAEPLKERFQHVLVDEYQDTNKLQGEIVDLCAQTHGNLTVVGDDAQSIYSFRGAHYENIIAFPERHPGTQVFKLERNYRSVPEILNLANKSIRNNQRQFPKVLEATRGAGMQPVLLPLFDVYQQADFVAQRVLELHQQEDVPLRHIAVLYRAHSHSMELQLELTRREIPFRVRSGLRFFEQAHIKDVLSYLRLVHNPVDPLAWQRVLRTWSGVGRRSAEHVMERTLSVPHKPLRPAEVLNDADLRARLPKSAHAAIKRLAGLFAALDPALSLSEMVRQVLDAHYRDYALSAFPNGETRVDDLEQLADYARQYSSTGEDTLERFLSEIALVAGFGAEAPKAGEHADDCLTLSTIHQAKGLEWRAVFILALADTLFPQPMATRSNAELEEERRLFYVAATRAKDQLYLCHPRFEEPSKGPRKLLRLSRFVDELGDDGVVPYDRWEIVES